MTEKIREDGERISLKARDDTLWYPPLGLMKLSEFHKKRGDEVKFVTGCDASVMPSGDEFDPNLLWDRVYITTLFTFHFNKIAKTINFYKKAVGGTLARIYVGGIMASLMPDDLAEACTIYPVTGVLTTPKHLGLPGKVNIDRLPPDYDLLDPSLYAINDTYYAYTTRGCINKCAWCGVPEIESQFSAYIDIKPMIKKLRKKHGDKAKLKLMDNNVLASPKLADIVEDLLALGYGKGCKTNSQPPRQRIIDFNQGVDASFFNSQTMELLSQLNIKPLRIAFDRLAEKKQYEGAVRLAIKYGFQDISNYMLYNFKDTPKDLFERMCINIAFNEEWVSNNKCERRLSGKIYSYPMRFAPIRAGAAGQENRKRDLHNPTETSATDWRSNPCWTPLFIRNIEVMKGAAHGAISPTPTLARRTIGKDWSEFLANLYMPEELLRNRNKHERRVYAHEPQRKPGSGRVEEFRSYIRRLLRSQNSTFSFFHDAVTPNRVDSVRASIKECKDQEMKKWLKLYVAKK